MNGWDRLAASVLQEDWRHIRFDGLSAQTPSEFLTLCLAEDYLRAEGGGREKAAALREVVAECQRLRAHVIGAPTP